MINIVHPRVDVKPPVKKVQPMKNNVVDGRKNNCEENRMEKFSDENENVFRESPTIFREFYEIFDDFQGNSGYGVSMGKEIREEKQENSASSFNEILSFLEKFEDGFLSGAKTGKTSFDFCENPAIFHAKTSVNSNRFNFSEKTAILDGLRADLATSQLQLREKESTILLLTEELKKERKSSEEKLEFQRKSESAKLETRENQNRNVVKRHQKFIERLIAEKTDLTEKCNSLTQRVKEIEAKGNRDLKVLAERHSVELQKSKELCAAAEKIKREKWLQTKTAKIKEMTVKGLEPEMRNMVERHQRELQDLRATNVKELQETELRVVRQYSEQLEKLRIDLTATHEKTLTNERETISKRYREKFEEQESQFREQERKFAEDLAKEREKFEKEKLRRQEEKDFQIEEMRREFQKQTELLKEREENKVRALKESLETEWEISFKNHQKRQEEKFRQAEEIARKESERERDKLVELAIKRIERENRETKEKLQENFAISVRRLKEKYETQVKVVTHSYETQKIELSTTEKQLRGTEERLKIVEEELNVCKENLTRQNELVKQLTEERNTAKSLARREIELEKRELHEKIDSLRQEISRNKSNNEILMAQLHSRIKLVLTQKMLTIKNLTGEFKDCKRRCERLEELLNQQRKEYILKSL